MVVCNQALLFPANVNCTCMHTRKSGSGSRLSVKRSLTHSFEEVANQNSDSKHLLPPKGANEEDAGWQCQ